MQIQRLQMLEPYWVYVSVHISIFLNIMYTHEPCKANLADWVAAFLKGAIVRNTHADLQGNALALPSKRFRSKATCRTDSESDMEKFFRMMQMMKEMAKGMDEPKIDVLTTRRRSTSSSRSSEAPERLALDDLPQGTGSCWIPGTACTCCSCNFGSCNHPRSTFGQWD